ncbi:MAG: nucleotidyltransferase domain-containing protein [Acidobacteria bacterium]|nr:nucleotidyltransferase domain-containing protein [Acidobacteriota bacterium]
MNMMSRRELPDNAVRVGGVHAVQTAGRLLWTSRRRNAKRSFGVGVWYIGHGMTDLEGVRDDAIRRIGDDLARGMSMEPTVRLAWLFGSRVRGTARAESDIDVAVLVDDACAAGPGALKDSYFRVIGVLGRTVRSDLIDLVILNHAPPLLRHRVVRDGVLLYACSDAERVRFVRSTLREYLDMEPWFREQTRLLIRRLKEERARHDGRHQDLREAARRPGRLSAAAAQPRRSQ